MSDRQERATPNDGIVDQDFTVGTSANDLMTNGKVNMKTLERCFIESIDRKMSNIVDKSDTESKTKI